MKSHVFLLANQYDDIWYWERDLLSYFYGELLEQIFNFFQGPLALVNEEQIVMNQSGDNDFHVVAYAPAENKESVLRDLKNFRKFNTKNTDRFFHFKYWLVEDPKLAATLGLKEPGQVQLIRPASPFNLGLKNLTLCGYKYSSEKVLSGSELAADALGSSSYAKILQHAFNSPIIVRDYMQFALLTQKFKTNVLVVYCDPEADPEYFKQVQKSLVRARKALRINLLPDESGML